MATLYVNTDDQSGGEYASLALAEAALPATLTEPYVIECAGTIDDATGVNFTGFSTSSLNTLSITGNLMDGLWNNNNYTISRASGWWYTLETDIEFVWFKRLQISGGHYGIVYLPATINSGLDSCYIKDTNNKIAVYRGVVKNTLYMGRDGITTESAYRYQQILDNSVGMFTSGSIAVGNSYDASVNGPRNCIFFGVLSNNWSVNFQNCIFNGDVPGTGQANPGCIGNQLAADIFTDPANGDFTLKANSPAIGAGADLSATFTTDITGATRATPWDIGAFMYAVGGGDIDLTLIDALHNHTAARLALAQQHQATITAGQHDHRAAELALVQQHLAQLESSRHAHIADYLDLDLAILLFIVGSRHDHRADTLTATQQHALTVIEAIHAHTTDPLTLLLGEMLLSIQAATHQHRADGLPLQQQHQLSLAGAYHAHLADNITVDMALILAIADALHAHGSDSIDLDQQHNLAVKNIIHAHQAGTLDLTQLHDLTMADAIHAHSADDILLFIHGQGLGIIADTTIISLTPQRDRLNLTIQRTIKHV